MKRIEGVYVVICDGWPDDGAGVPLYNETMTRTEALARLQAYGPAIKARGATSLYLYGSTVRDEAGAESDLDLFIDYDPSSRFNAFDLIGIKLFLEDELHARVDVTTRDGLHPRLRYGIEQSAVRVF